MKTKGLILLVVCIAYFVAGHSVYTTPVTNLDVIRQLDPSITAHTDMFTLHQIGLIFMITSVIAVLLGLFRRLEWGYGLMTFLLVWWSALYLVSWYSTGYWQSIYGFINYGLTASLLILVSRLVEVPKGAKESLEKPLPFGDVNDYPPNGASS